LLTVFLGHFELCVCVCVLDLTLGVPPQLLTSSLSCVASVKPTMLSRQATRTWKALSEQCFYGQTLSATGSITTAHGMLSLCKVREDGHVMSALCQSVALKGSSKYLAVLL